MTSSIAPPLPPPGEGPAHLGRLAEGTLERLGDHPALLFEGRWHDRSQLVDRSTRAAHGLAGLGISPGDRVALVMANCPEVSIAYTAIWRAGAVATPVLFLVSTDELRHILADSGAVAVITTPEFLPKVAAAAGPQLRRTVVVGDAAPDSVAWSELEAADPAPLVDRADDDLAALLYTGGTTGRAKGVMLTHGNLYAAAWGSSHRGFVPGVTRALVPLPLAHAYGLIVTVVGGFAREPGAMVLMRWFDPAGWLALAAAERVHTAPVVPSMLAVLLGQPLEDYDLSALRFVGSGGAALAPELAREFMRRVPGVSVAEGYGCTESAAIIATSPPDAPRLGTVGMAAPGVEVRIAGPDGAPLPAGRDGEVLARGRGIMAGYWHAPEQTADTVRDGWLHTGDVGRLDDDGYLTIVDRTKDLIIRGGFNVYPRDVEDVLVAHPAVSMAAVVGRPHLVHGEEVVGFVALRAGAEVAPAELVAWAKERLSATKYPREVHVVDAIPLTSVGKTDRKSLRGRVAGG